MAAAQCPYPERAHNNKAGGVRLRRFLCACYILRALYRLQCWRRIAAGTGYGPAEELRRLEYTQSARSCPDKFFKLLRQILAVSVKGPSPGRYRVMYAL
jgi:hypothetical protein